MTHSNIERFDEIVGQAFARLYQSFPRPLHMTGRSFLAQDGDIGRTDEADFCTYCLYWLLETGYINGTKDHPDGVKGAVLSAKGLETLKAMPASLNAPLGARIVDAAKHEGREALRALVGQALGMGMQWLVR